MAYSYMTAISDGTLKSMPITFNYMKEDDLVVHHNITKLTKGIDYTINNNIITFAKVIPALDRIAVDRMSQRDTLRVDFTEGATFSRDNIDDVLTQLLYLTQEAVEGSVDRISPTGVLDLAGNRIINLGDPVDLQDAVPLHLVVDAEKSVYASEAKCKQYRDEALGYKDAAFTSADRAYASELNAKKSEEIALQLLAESAEASKLVTENLPEMRELAASAEESADRAEAMVDRVEDALAGVEGYGSRVTALEGKVKGRITMAGSNDLKPANSVNGLTYSWVNSSNIEGGDSLTTYTGNVLQVCGAELHVSQIVVGHEGIRYRNIWNNTKYEWARVYDTNKPPTCDEIGAVASSNVVGTLAEGALFEKYYTPDGWTVIKRIDGTMEMSKKGTISKVPKEGNNFSVISGETKFPESFSQAPTASLTLFGSSIGAIYQVVRAWHDNPESHFQNKTGAILVTFIGSSATVLSCSYVATFHGFWANISGISTLEEPELEESNDAPQVLPYDLGIYKKEY